ncbi:MAG: hypothetical protein K6V73_04905 [Firmicutes bacterium]|nr:hypothetical protein [Bacillota bacterium]
MARPARALEVAVDPGSVYEAAPDRLLRVGLASLWLLDGLLQAQPGMFTMDMVSTIMQPAATGQPGWLSGLVHWSVVLVTPRVAAFNWGVVLLQLAIGAFMLAPPGAFRRLGVVLGGAWALVVWVFGEGLGQLLTGSATPLSGAPGSAFVYLVGAVVLLWPGGAASARIAGRSAVAVAASAILALSALLQLNPLFFTSLGLSSPFGQAAMMGQPSWLRAPIAWAATAAASAPVAANALAVLLFALAAAWLWQRPTRRWEGILLAVTLVWLGLVWWLGQDFGMPFSGMETDPNTAAPLALLVFTAYVARRRALAGRGSGVTQPLAGKASSAA